MPIPDSTPRPARRPFAGIAAVEHAIAVLKALPRNGGALGINEIARRVGLHKSTVSRVVETLLRHDFVSRHAEDGRVGLGPGLLSLVGPMLGRLDINREARPLLERVATETGETTSLAIWTGSDVVMVDHVLGEHAVMHYSWNGRCVPAHCTAAGKVFLAHLGPQAFDRLLAAGLEAHTPHTIVDPARLRRELDRVRRLGVARNVEEYERESCGIAAPVWNIHGEVVAAVTVAAPKFRFSAERQEVIGWSVRAAAGELSRRLGHVAEPARAPAR